MTTSNAAAVQASVDAAIRKIGRVFNPDVLQATYALYEPLQKRAPKDGVEIHKDFAYGEHARHRLDVFVPAKRPTKAPIVVYFHGGGYSGGERSPLPGLIYDNVPTFFARRGLIAANATYRLAPEHKWPSGALDVGRSVAWLRANAERFGGDPDRVFVMGQSAGGTHVANWAFSPQVHGPAGPGVAGVILLSAVLAPHDAVYSPDPPAPHRTDYFGEDPAKWPDMNPINTVRPNHPPVFISVAEFDPYPLQWSSPAFVAALVKCDKKMPWFVYSRNHNHVSPAMQINSEIDRLGPEIEEFLHSVS